MEYQTLSVEREGAAVIVTLDRAEKRNALNQQMRAELAHAVRAERRDARVLVLTGAGSAFCAGQDLGDGHGGTGSLERTLRDEYEPLIRAITECPVPTLAAVNGAAAGAGANIALACDVVIAAESAVFHQAFARVGLLPDGGATYWLPRGAGTAKAMGAALFAEPITACEASDWGMIWECARDDDFAAHWRARMRQLAEGPTEAYRAIKAAIRSGRADLAGQLSFEAELQGRLAESRDAQEGLAAFAQRRTPRFEGR